MSYFRKPLSGLGGVENCGTDQVWDPNIEFSGLKGQCMPRANYSASQLVNPNAIPGVVKSAGGSGSSGIADFFKALVSATPVAQPAGQPIYVQQASSGISTTTIAVAGAGALLLLYLATRK